MKGHSADDPVPGYRVGIGVLVGVALGYVPGAFRVFFYLDDAAEAARSQRPKRSR